MPDALTTIPDFRTPAATQHALQGALRLARETLDVVGLYGDWGDGAEPAGTRRSGGGV